MLKTAAQSSIIFAPQKRTERRRSSQTQRHVAPASVGSAECFGAWSVHVSKAGRRLQTSVRIRMTASSPMITAAIHLPPAAPSFAAVSTFAVCRGWRAVRRTGRSPFPPRRAISSRRPVVAGRRPVIVTIPVLSWRRSPVPGWGGAWRITMRRWIPVRRPVSVVSAPVRWRRSVPRRRRSITLNE